MDIRNSMEGLRSLLGVTPSTPSVAQAKGGTASKESAALGSDQATLSSAASQMAMTAADGGVRADKVAQVQAALAAGTYNVPASVVASSLVDAMLSGAH